MKQSPWVLPASWRWATFSDVARVASDLVDPGDFPDAPHIAPNHIESETGRLLPFTTVRADNVTSAKHRFRAGQVLYSKIRPYLAKVVVVDFDGLCSADMYPIDTELESSYLKWWMLTREFTRQAAGQQARTVLPKINKRSLAGLPVPVAPRDEQRRIVDILEDNLSRLDAADQLTFSAEVKLDAWRQACIDQLVWDSTARRVPLSSVLREPMRNGHSAKATRDGSGIRTLTLTAVTRGDFSEQFIKMTRADPHRVAGLWLRAGDILVERSNTPELVGTAALYDGPDDWAVYPDLVIRVRVEPSIATPRYVAGVIRSERAHRWLRDRAKGLAGSMPKIDQGTIGALEVPLSSLDEQVAIAAQIQSVEINRDRLHRESCTARRRSAALRRALLQAAFAGRLTGSSTDVELIEELAGV